jgi:hypothetical protein
MRQREGEITFAARRNVILQQVPPLPELRFAEIPARSRQRYTGDRFSHIEAGPPDRRGR